MKLFALLLCLPLATLAAPPAELAIALEYLRDQRSYSWEMINADPGAAQEIQTFSGSVVSSMPRPRVVNLKGTIDRRGDIFLQREWSDGLQLDTWITAGGATVTRTPEGWMTAQEILTALAEERLREGGPGPRLLWLRRADRPQFPKPHEELGGLLKASTPFEDLGDSTYRIRGRASAGQYADEDRGYNVVMTLRVSGGVVRDYEIEIEGADAIRQAGVKIPIKEHHIVVLTYVAVSQVNVPPEARMKLETRPSADR